MDEINTSRTNGTGVVRIKKIQMLCQFLILTTPVKPSLPR